MLTFLCPSPVSSFWTSTKSFTSTPQLPSPTSSRYPRRFSRSEGWQSSLEVRPSLSTLLPLATCKLLTFYFGCFSTAVIRDHKLSLFQAREAALIRENENLSYLNEELVVRSLSFAPCPSFNSVLIPTSYSCRQAENEDFAVAHAELNHQLDKIYAERDQLQSDIINFERKLSRAGKSRSGEMEKWEKEREEAEVSRLVLLASAEKPRVVSDLSRRVLSPPFTRSKPRTPSSLPPLPLRRLSSPPSSLSSRLSRRRRGRRARSRKVG